MNALQMEVMTTVTEAQEAVPRFSQVWNTNAALCDTDSLSRLVSQPNSTISHLIYLGIFLAKFSLCINKFSDNLCEARLYKLKKGAPLIVSVFNVKLLFCAVFVLFFAGHLLKVH